MHAADATDANKVCLKLVKETQKKKLHKKRREKEGRNEASAEEKNSQRKILRERKTGENRQNAPHYEILDSL